MITTQNSSLNILVVDDDPILLRVVEHLLKQQKYTVRTAASGMACMNSIKQEKPDLLLLDVMLPDISGIEVCNRIKSDPGLSSIHVLMISGIQIESENVSEGLETGADGYLIKPVQHRELLANVGAAFRLIRAERALQRSELKYRSLIECSTDIIFCVNEKGEYRFTNHLFAATFGKTPDYFIGKTFWDVYDKEHADHRFEATKRLFESGESESLEVEVPLPDRTLYFLATTNPIKDETGKVILNLTHATDITELKKTEKALAESYQFNSHIINSEQEGVIVFDLDLCYRVWNPFMEKLTGTPSSQVIGKHISELFPFLADTGITGKVKSALSGEPFGEGDFPFHLSDSGKSGWSSCKISPLKHADGEISGVIVNVHDITVRKEAEEALAASEAQLANALDIAKLGPWVYDVASDTFTFNDHFYAVFHTTVEREGGYSMTSAQYANRFVHPDDILLVSTETQKAEETTDPNFSRKLEHRFIYADGNTGYLNVEFFIIKDAQGRTVKTYGVNQDITERKLAEVKIQRRTNELAALLKISQELAETLDLKDILQLTTDRATELTEMKTSALYLLEGETIRLWATTPPLPGLFPEELRNAPLADHLHIRKAITTGMPVFLHDTATAKLTPAERAVTEIRGLRSILYLPLKAGTKVFGALILSSILEPQSLTESEVNLCNTLANLAALAVVNAQLFESEQVYVEKLREQVAELVQTEEELKKSKERYRQLFDLANEGLLLLTMNGDIAEVNQSFAQMHGYTVDEIRKINIRDLDVLGQHTFDGHAKIIERILAGEVVRFEPEHYHKDGHRFSLSNTVSLITIENQHYFLAFHQDITERKQAEMELVIAKERAEQSDRLKSAFLANMSHEIRTPMNGILGFAELLKEPGLSGQEQQQFIRIIEKSGARMLNIINDIVDISKIESGQMEISLAETDINEKIEYIYTFFKPEIEKKNLQFSFKNSLPAKEAMIKTDREKIYAILINLVKNAVKFTNEGSIEIGYTVEADNYQSQQQLQFYVKDTGIGIPKNRQAAIFERFIQADILDKEALQGAGLGLSISRAYVEMVGGKIWVESEVGKGSAFYFTIPFHPVSKE